MMCVLALETTTMGVFLSLDLILFFVFWELMLIPSYFLIKLWGGGAERHYAALKFVIYTLLGSVFMLVGIALLNINYHHWASLHHSDQAYSFDLLDLLTVPIPISQQMLIFWLMFLGFAFKAPVFPFHTWLPDAWRALLGWPLSWPVSSLVPLASCGSVFRCSQMHRKARPSFRFSWCWDWRRLSTGALWRWSS
jgi:NADH:ubiquinone oxidoreductase subunit 4 (subunit M)